MEKPNKLVWTDLVSDELKDMLFNLKSDNGFVPLGTVDKLVQLFVNDIERLGNQSSKSSKNNPYSLIHRLAPISSACFFIAFTLKL